jgi:tripartite ATP-independent transporter DctP family solute receptor
MNKSLHIIFFVAAVWLFFGCKNREDTKVLRLAHGLDVSHPVHKGMVYMAEQLKKKSGGKLTIEIYPGGQLGAERQCLELLQIGSLDMTKVSSAVMEGFAPRYRVLGLPYIFRDKTHFHHVLDGEVGTELLREGNKFRLHGLCFYDAGARSFYTINKPILKPDDLKGMKIRVMKSNTAVAMVNAFGGSPTPISWGELYTSLQQNVVDGAENNPPSFYTSHHFEVCKYYSLDEHAAVPDVLLINTTTWQKLSEQEKQWLTEAAKESGVEQRKLWDEAEKEAFDALQKSGVKIYHPDKAPFIRKVKALYAKYENDTTLAPLIHKIRNCK